MPVATAWTVQVQQQPCRLGPGGWSSLGLVSQNPRRLLLPCSRSFARTSSGLALPESLVGNYLDYIVGLCEVQVEASAWLG